jgi:hypothetical protein
VVQFLAEFHAAAVIGAAVVGCGPSYVVVQCCNNTPAWAGVVRNTVCNDNTTTAANNVTVRLDSGLIMHSLLKLVDRTERSVTGATGDYIRVTT